MEWHQLLIGGGGLTAAARLLWAAWRRTHPLKPTLPFVERLYRVGTSATLLLFCRMENRQKSQVILDLLNLMEQAGIAVSEIKEYRRRYGSISDSGTGSPYDSWLDEDSTSTNPSPPTPSSSPSSDPTAPARSKKSP